MNKYAFEQGLLAVCHKYGVNPSALVKFAQYIDTTTGTPIPTVGGVPLYDDPGKKSTATAYDFSGYTKKPLKYNVIPPSGDTSGNLTATVNQNMSVPNGKGGYLPQVTLHESFEAPNEVSSTTPGVSNAVASNQTAGTTPTISLERKFSYVPPIKDPKTGKLVTPDNGKMITGDPSSVNTAYTGGTKSYTKFPEISQDGTALQWKPPQTRVQTTPKYTQPPNPARSLRPNVPDPVGPPVENPFYTPPEPRYARYAQPRYSYTPPATPTRQAGQVTYYKPRNLGRATFKGRTKLGY